MRAYPRPPTNDAGSYPSRGGRPRTHRHHFRPSCMSGQPGSTGHRARPA